MKKAWTITFGMHMDGQRPQPPANMLGDVVVGPLGLLNLLETQLGLLAQGATTVRRITEMQGCLAELNHPDRFYHRSFEADAQGTASRLLKWRDEWWLHGWSGTIDPQATSRLRDMADVEELAKSRVAPSMGQRLHSVAARLSGRNCNIGEILLVEAFDALPVGWQRVIAMFPNKQLSRPQAQGSGFLGRLQTRLSREFDDTPVPKLAWDADGSVTVVRAETRTLAAQWVASQLNETATESTLLMVESGGAYLDAHLHASGGPRQGLKEQSMFRPALQVLPLVLDLLWAPLNIQALILFLNHSVSPIPGWARRQLAERVADTPGIGGPTWTKLLRDIELEEAQRPTQVARAAVALWLEHERYIAADGAPLDAVISRVKALAEFFQGRLADLDEAKRLAFIAAHHQCKASLEALAVLAEHGQTRIRPRQIHNLVAQATAHGTDNPMWAAQVGAVETVCQPEAVISGSDRVIWWQMVSPSPAEPSAWSEQEKAQLRESGVRLPDPTRLMELASQAWLRPILAARSQLVLVLPCPSAEVHPVWQMIQAACGQPVILQLESLLNEGCGQGMQAIQPCPLTEPRRWWALPEEVVIPKREQESFSSLELMIFNPYHWLLKYPAALRGPRLFDLHNDFRLNGNLAHSLIEHFFLQPDALAFDDEQFNTWYASMFDQSVEQEGAHLLMPGRKADAQRFRQRLQSAMHRLRRHLREARTQAIEPEVLLSGSFQGGELTGSADLVLHNAQGKRAIVDIKWAGHKKYMEKLKNNGHLQLALYAELLRQKTGDWPAVAYFVIDKAELLVPDDSVFKGAKVVSSSTASNTAQLWECFKQSWAWRQAQFDQRLFEVVMDDIEPTENSVPPDVGLKAETLNPSYNEYRHLAGWRA